MSFRVGIQISSLGQFVLDNFMSAMPLVKNILPETEI